MAEAAPPPADFDTRRLLLLAGVVLVVVIATFFLFLRGCGSGGGASKTYTIIYSNLELKDAANVVARLKELSIPYEIKNEGRAIAVPKNRTDQARFGLAEKNLPAGGVVGWEIFDETKLGATDFDRRIQLIRAISGELSRTIRRIQAIEDVRVQIVIPETRLFAATVVPVTASVLLRLKPGADLPPGKVNGIVHLVASSVENLKPENVTVIDNTGRILTAKEARTTKKAMLSVKRTLKPKPVEKPRQAHSTPQKSATMESKTTSPEAAAPISKPLTIEEKILLRVRAKKELEENLAGKAQEILNRFYPPNSVIIKVTADTNSFPKKKEPASTNLEIKKITAIILVDNRVDISKQLKESTFKSVAAAIGYNRRRGDRILLQKVPFHLATPPPAVVKEEFQKVLPEAPKKKALVSLSPPWLLFGGGLAVLIIFFVFRMFRKSNTKLETPETLPEAAVPPPPENPPSVLENVKSMAEKNPERIAELLRSWLTE